MLICISVVYSFLLLSNIPLNGTILLNASTGYPSLGDEYLDCFQFLDTRSKALMNFHVQVFVWTSAFILLSKYLRVERVHPVTCLCNFLRKCQTFFRSDCTILHSHQEYMRVSVPLHPCQYSV